MATIDGTKENIEQIIDGNEVVVIDFWAEWCGPCKTFAPVFEEASDKHDDIAFVKIDTEAQPELAAAFGVKAIPTLVVFREQIGLLHNAGALPPEALTEVITKVRDVDMEEVRAEVEKTKSEGDEGAEGEGSSS